MAKKTGSPQPPITVVVGDEPAKVIRVDEGENTEPRAEEDPPGVRYDNEHVEIGLETNDVIIHRFRDTGTVIGPETMVRPLVEMATNLVRSGHMERWLTAKVVEAIKLGAKFAYRGPKGDIRAVYRLCTDEDVRELSKRGRYVEAVTRSSDMVGAGRKDVTDRIGKQSESHKEAAARRGPPGGPGKIRSNSNTYMIVEPKKGADQGLQAQVREVLLILWEHVGASGGSMVGEEIKNVLEKNRARLKTKPDRDLMSLFSFCMSNSFKRLGLVVRE